MSISLGIWTPIHSGEFTSIGKNMKPGSEAKDHGFDVAKEVIQLADSHGFEYTLVASRFIGNTLEPLTTTAALAAVTKQIRFVVAIHSGLMQPQIVAKMGASIDQISEGRFHINLVSGWWEEQHLMYGGMWLDHDERYALSSEFIQVIKGMWTEEPFNFEGKYYQVKNATMMPKPYQRPFPETFVGGKSEPTYDLVAKDCEWLFLSGYSYEQIPEIMRNVRERADRHGRKVRFAVSGFVLLRDSLEEAQEAARELDELGARDPLAKIHTKGLITDWVGPAQKIADRLNQLEELGVEMALLQMNPIQREMRRFCDQVVPLMDLPAPEAVISETTRPLAEVR